ncbi:enoyl-CoA hydratase-related protein [Thermosyntropha sp.]|uniref:enoyl-CoA hydratase-related protein n=1 Tax=Thermosyntropha sp. TaxID=2740820 RepID=UPI0025CDC12C|nr:enoyl-CoA hydratase-related protein [Thermosyntropha sp.]MBO8158079.1 enoyl-CoA hydratase/isomerase family protein [Thermosyntropha sp.]
MSYRYVKIERENYTGILWVSRPEVLNALNTEVLMEIGKAIDELGRDEGVRAIIVTGVGDKAFVAGADIREMQSLNAVQGRSFGKTGQEVFRKIEELEKPVIAAINGFALGGGCELAMAADIRLASDKAKFGQPEVTLGIIPGFGGTQRLSRLIGKGRAMELILTGSMISAEEAYRIGLVNYVYPANELLKEAKKMAEKITSNAPLAVKFAKSAINKGGQTDIDTGMSIEADLFGLCFATEDQKSGMKAFINKEKVEFKGC